jgi:flagellar hook-associated protein 2
VGTTNTYDVESATNTFAGVLPGTTFTLSGKPADPVTVTVASDPDAVANSVQALVTAANAALDKITKYTSTTSSSSTAAVLKGDFSLTSLAGQVLTAVSSAVGGDGSAAKAGLQTDRYGKLVFDATAFKKQLATDPALAQRLFTGTPATKDANGAAVAAVPGVAARLQTLADKASNTTTGTLVSLASGQDTRAKDLQAQIDDWDTRLAARQATLTAQFTAMETALSTLKNQSSWLSSQLGSLTTSSSKS